MSARLWLHWAPWITFIAACVGFNINERVGLILLIVHAVGLFVHTLYVGGLERLVKKLT